ncbi:unnamed protein product [Callosobruchus maculatus]|uniref:Uncharacterized protein n=1 Tax=Callosobruchus maculatus TaxID=64391 RepID=A0A653CKZ6_CALMS|nr:unnamed protein product [Callosobruchus maculatus]
MTMTSYVTLYTPALDFILQAVACTVKESVLTDILNSCKQCNNSSLILHTIMSSFKPAYVAQRAADFVDMIIHCSDESIPLYSLLRMLGLCLNVCPPPSEQRRHILTTVWKYISALTNPAEYIACVEAWIQYVVANFSNRDINIILGDIIEHMSPNRNFENFYNELKVIVSKIVSYNQDFEMLLVMDNFLPLIDLFQQETIKVEVCKNILTNNFTCFTTNDPVTTNALMFLCTVLHDSVNALTPEDEYRQIGEILCNIIRKVDYGRDFEQQMNFYVEARGAFSNIDTVLAELVQRVNLLSINTRHIVKGIHTRKTADFVRACAAYCFITIPSIVSEKTRLELYMLSGKVALFNQCLGQADACFKAVLSMLSDLQDTTVKSETFLSSFIREFLSTLVVVPDNPERGVLILLKGLLNVIRDMDWNKQNCVLGSLYINVLDLLSAMSQEEYPYHVDRVESNDALYGSDPKFLSEINTMCSIIVGEVLTLLKELGNCRRQSQLAVELFLRIALRADLGEKALSVLAQNLWQLSLKNGNGDVKYMAKTKEYLRKYSIATSNIKLHQLVDKMAV